jgi:hypothetical protein
LSGLHGTQGLLLASIGRGCLFSGINRQYAAGADVAIADGFYFFQTVIRDDPVVSLENIVEVGDQFFRRQQLRYFREALKVGKRNYLAGAAWRFLFWYQSQKPGGVISPKPHSSHPGTTWPTNPQT